jgi:hypothetical protein
MVGGPWLSGSGRAKKPRTPGDGGFVSKTNKSGGFATPLASRGEAAAAFLWLVLGDKPKGKGGDGLKV